MNQLLRTVQVPLQRYILRLIGDRTAAENVLQETLVRIYRKLPWLDDPLLFQAWAYRIASREALRFLQRRQRRRDHEVDPSEIDAMPEATTTPTETLSAGEVDRLIEQASPASRAVLILHYQHEMNLEEVAAVLGISLGTVKSRLAYGLRKLRQTLSRKDYER